MILLGFMLHRLFVVVWVAPKWIDFLLVSSMEMTTIHSCWQLASVHPPLPWLFLEEAQGVNWGEGIANWGVWIVQLLGMSSQVNTSLTRHLIMGACCSFLRLCFLDKSVSKLTGSLPGIDISFFRKFPEELLVHQLGGITYICISHFPI